MIEFLLNPYGISYTAWVIFAVGLIICTAVGIAVGIVSMFRSREKRDGLR